MATEARHRSDHQRIGSDGGRTLKIATVAFAIAVGVHGLDHAIDSANNVCLNLFTSRVERTADAHDN